LDDALDSVVRIDARYVIPAAREIVWSYLTDPAKEQEYGWNLNGPNEVLARRPDGVRFRGGRDRTLAGRKPFESTFEGTFDKAAWRLHWRIVQGFEAGSDYVEELLPHAEGTEIHAHGTIRLRNVDWDQRVSAFFFPKRARALIERNVCRDYKRLKEHLSVRAAVVA
jgi:hypothetical protein